MAANERNVVRSGDWPNWKKLAQRSTGTLDKELARFVRELGTRAVALTEANIRSSGRRRSGWMQESIYADYPDPTEVRIGSHELYAAIQNRGGYLNTPQTVTVKARHIRGHQVKGHTRKGVRVKPYKRKGHQQKQHQRDPFGGKGIRIEKGYFMEAQIGVEKVFLPMLRQRWPNQVRRVLEGTKR